MEFDYVIVGGGSAGCVLAGRLSADQKTRVCLRLGGELHGQSGPLNVADQVSPNPINEVFLSRGRPIKNQQSTIAVVEQRFRAMQKASRDAPAPSEAELHAHITPDVLSCPSRAK